jgi:hypothetical protein
MLFSWPLKIETFEAPALSTTPPAVLTISSAVPFTSILVKSRSVEENCSDVLVITEPLPVPMSWPPGGPIVNKNRSLKVAGVVTEPTVIVFPIVAVTGLVPVNGLPVTTKTAGAGLPGVMSTALATEAKVSADAPAKIVINRRMLLSQTVV